MDIKRIIRIVLLLVVLVPGLTGCRKYQEITISGAKVETVSFSGFRSVNIVMTVDIHNPAGKLDVREADGVLKGFGKVLGKVTVNPFTVPASTDNEHRVTMALQLGEDVSIREVMSLMDMNRLLECTADVHVKGKVAGIWLQKNMKDIPMKKLIEN